MPTVNYERLDWEDYPSEDTPLNAENLNRMEEGIAGLYEDVEAIENHDRAYQLELIPDLLPIAQAQGNPVALHNAVGGLPIEDLELTVTPKQNLHGYDGPWPAGAGKNLLPMTVSSIKIINTSGTWDGNTYSINGLTFAIVTDADSNVIGIKANGTPSSTSTFDLYSSFTIKSGTYRLSSEYPDPGSSKPHLYLKHSGSIYVREYGGDFTIEDYTIVNFVSIQCPSNVNVSNFTFKPMLRLASETDSTFAPYSNICPIAGTDEMWINTGKNLCIDSPSFEGYSRLDGWDEETEETYEEYETYSTSTNGAVASTRGIHLPAGTYHASAMVGYKNYYACTIGGSLTYDSGQMTTLPSDYSTASPWYIRMYWARPGITFTLTEPGTVWIYVRNDSTYSYKLYLSCFQIEEGSTPTAYEPWNNGNVPISFDHTLYNAVVNITGGNAVEKAIGLDLGDLDYTYVTTDENPYFTAEIPDGNISQLRTITPISSIYSYVESLSSVVETNGSFNLGYTMSLKLNVRIRDDRYTDPSDFKEALAGQIIVYEANTPVSYDITPHEIYTSSEGNIITTNGDTIDATYRLKPIHVPSLPTGNGTYYLKFTKTNSESTMIWEQQDN